MELAAGGFVMMAVFLFIVIRKAMSVVTAMIVVPIGFGLLAGAGQTMGGMIITSLIKLAPTACALVFAVYFFALMMDAGLFSPMVEWAVRWSEGDPVKVSLATSLVILVTACAGNGATVSLVAIGAFLPVYEQLKLPPMNLAILLATSSVVINLMPWGGTMLRVASALNVEIMDIFMPLLPTLLVGAAGNMAIAFWLGWQGRKTQVGAGRNNNVSDIAVPQEHSPSTGIFWSNVGLTIAVVVMAVFEVLPLPVTFMVGLALALLLNFRGARQQNAFFAKHAANVINIVLLVFAAAVFTGVLAGTGAIGAMGQAINNALPEAFGPHFGLVVAALSGPLNFIMTNDAFYYGIVPLLAETAQHFGLNAEEIGRASILGVTMNAISPLVAAVYIVAGLLKLEVTHMQLQVFPFAAFIYVLMVATALLSGAVPY
ncbi:MAG: citrate transporter [Flavobacteriaceae bacterium]|nr:citrate transporter [Flavobacteriaceae bacterium]